VTGVEGANPVGDEEIDPLAHQLFYGIPEERGGRRIGGADLSSRIDDQDAVVGGQKDGLEALAAHAPLLAEVLEQWGRVAAGGSF
jgi:hypothetical protein